MKKPSLRSVAVFASGTLIGIASTGIAATVRGSDVFRDVPRGSYYDNAVGEMYALGVIKGYNSTTFAPNDYVTRGQVAVMMQRLRAELTGTVIQEPSDSASSAPSNDDSNDTQPRSSARTSSTRSSGSRVSSSSKSSSSSYNPRGYFRFTTTVFSVNENTASATISVVRTGGNEGSVTVKYSASGGTATAGTDFEAISGTLSFAAKETSKTFTIVIKDDSLSEANETILLLLSEPTGASMGTPATSTLTIIDNESGGTSSAATGGQTSSSNPNGTIGFAALGYTVRESAGTLTVTVRRSGGTNGTVNVSYATGNGSGVSGKEYTQTNGTLSFAAGETSKTFTVPVTDNVSIDGNKTFTLTLTGPTGGANLGTSSVSVTIFDDDGDAKYGSGSIRFSKASYDVTESSGKAEIVVQRTGGAAGTVTVDYSTTSGTAASNDYTPVSGTLTFEPGESSKILTIPIIKDTTSDSGETVFINLSNVSPSTALLISPYSATLNIYD